MTTSPPPWDVDEPQPVFTAVAGKLDRKTKTHKYCLEMAEKHGSTYIRLGMPRTVCRTVELASGILIDEDSRGNAIGIEFLHASELHMLWRRNRGRHE